MNLYESTILLYLASTRSNIQIRHKCTIGSIANAGCAVGGLLLIVNIRGNFRTVLESYFMLNIVMIQYRSYIHKSTLLRSTIPTSSGDFAG